MKSVIIGTATLCLSMYICLSHLLRFAFMKAVILVIFILTTIGKICEVSWIKVLRQYHSLRLHDLCLEDPIVYALQ